jgi:hypothetical protein
MGKPINQRFIMALAVLIFLICGSTASASFMWTTETRSVTNVHDWNNPPGSSITTASSTGQFEEFIVSGRANQNSRFFSTAGAAHLVVTARYLPFTQVGLTTRNFDYGSIIVTAGFDVTGTEQFTYTPTLLPVDFHELPILNGPGGAMTLPAFAPTTGTLTAGHYTLSAQIIGTRGDTNTIGYSFDFAATPEPALACVPALPLLLARARRRRRIG